MSIQHAKPNEIVQLPLGMELANSKTTKGMKKPRPEVGLGSRNEPRS